MPHTSKKTEKFTFEVRRIGHASVLLAYRVLQPFRVRPEKPAELRL